MNVPMNTHRKRTGPIQPVFPYPYRYGLRGMGDCGDGSDPAYDACCATAEGCGGSVTTPTVALDLTCPAGQISDGAGGCTPTQLTATPGTNTTVVDSSGVTWTCDVNGNCCDPSMNCQAGPPSIATTVPTGATAAQAASASASNQSAASLVAALASAAAKASGVSTTGATNSVQCGNGVAVPAGQKCPTSTTPGIFGCPAGSTSINGACVPGAAIPAGQWFASMSNTQVILIGGGLLVIVGLVASMSGGGRRRR